MSFRKTILPVILTFAVAIAVCLYFLSIYNTYDGAVNVSFIVWAFISPFFYISAVYSIAKGKNKYVEQKRWQKILSLLILLMLTAFSIYSLVRNPYNLPAIMLIIFLPLALILDFIQRKTAKKLAEFSITEASLSVIGLYILAALIVFGYIAVVSPLSVDEAKDVVANRYSEENYEFGGYLNRIYINENTPLGVYFFYDADSSGEPLIEISVLNGDTVSQQNPPVEPKDS